MQTLLFGFRNANLDQTKMDLEKRLHVAFQDRESMYKGGNYCLYRGETGKVFSLQHNWDAFDHRPAEQTAADYPLILYVHHPLRGDEIKNTLTAEPGEGVLLSRTKTIER